MTPHSFGAAARPTGPAVLGICLDVVRDPMTGALLQIVPACFRHLVRRYDRVALLHECDQDTAFSVMEWTLDSGLDTYLTDTILIDPGTLADECRRLKVEVFLSRNLHTVTRLHGVVEQRWLVDDHGAAALPLGVQRAPTLPGVVLQSFPALRPGQLSELTPEDRGMFRVRTASSDHQLWLREDDLVLWRRVPAPGQRSLAEDHDDGWIPLTRVERWPKLGAVPPLFWFDDAVDPTIERWHATSLVASIAREG